MIRLVTRKVRDMRHPSMNSGRRPESVEGRRVASCSHVLGCVLLVCASASPAAEEEALEEFDEIVRKDKQPIMNVAIVEDNWKRVTGKKGEAAVPVPSMEVQEVVYSEAPRAFLKGVRRVARGFYTKAIDESFKPMLDKLNRYRKVDGHPWPKQYCLYYLGYSHLKRGEKGKGDPQKAREYLLKLVKEIPNTRFIFEAYMGIGDAYQVEKDYTKAAEAYKAAQKRFEQLTRETGLKIEQVKAIRRLAFLALIRQAEMFDLGGQYDKAVSLYKRIANLARDFEDIKFMARVGEVKAYVSLKQYETAIMKAEAMIMDGERRGHTEYLGGAYMALADCYFERAKKENKPEHLVVARYNYLRVLALYFMDEKVLPKARYRAGRCYEKLAGLKARGEGPRAKELAKRHYGLVVKRYPENEWAAEAKTRLAALGD